MRKLAKTEVRVVTQNWLTKGCETVTLDKGKHEMRIRECPRNSSKRWCLAQESSSGRKMDRFWINCEYRPNGVS